MKETKGHGEQQGEHEREDVTLPLKLLGRKNTDESLGNVRGQTL